MTRTAPAAKIRTAGAAAAFAAVVFFLFVPAAESFSLGRIQVTGGPGGRFEAVTTVQTGGREGLFVTVGGAADYRRLGLSRPEIIDSLSLRITDHPSDPDVKLIRVTSSEPVNLPSFNLVLKASLGGGTILENYFLAMDFQKELSLELPPEEEAEAVEKAARELAAIKASEEEEDKTSLLEKIREEEEQAERREETTRAMLREEALPGKMMEKAEKPEPEKEIHEKPEPEPAPAPEKPAPAMAAEEPAEEPAPEPEREIAEKPAPERVEPVQEAEKPAGGAIPVHSDLSKNVYTVKRGDSLYRIARRLGAKRGDLDQVVVALWKENPDVFIKGNIHGLRRGVTLDFSRVNETAAAMTRAKAARIINSQWPEWTGGGKAAASAGPSAPSSPGGARLGAEKPLVEVKVPAARLPYRDAVLAALAGWRERRGAAGGVEYDVENARLEKTGDGSVEATLTRREASGGGVTESPVTVRLARTGDGWEVVDETGAEDKKRAEETGMVYVAHVASYKSRESAERLVRLLRMKGFNAFEAGGGVRRGDGWYRVLVDRFSRPGEAEKFASSIRKTGISRYTRILRLPYALQAGDPADGMDEARRRMKRLADDGISAYILEADDGKPLVLVGAFEDERDAGAAISRLVSGGHSVRVVRP
ncbi:MAG: SPOR domain-containing protein [Candidatus Nitrospinota bacterium M3_3B_026]